MMPTAAGGVSEPVTFDTTCPTGKLLCDARLVPHDLSVPLQPGAIPSPDGGARWTGLLPFGIDGVDCELTRAGGDETLRIPLGFADLLAWCIGTALPLADGRRSREQLLQELDALKLAGLALVVTSAAGQDAETGAPLSPGINLVGQCRAAALLDRLDTMSLPLRPQADSCGVGILIVPPRAGVGDWPDIPELGPLADPAGVTLPGLHLSAVLDRTSVGRDPGVFATQGVAGYVPLRAGDAIEFGPTLRLDAAGVAARVAAAVPDSGELTLAGTFDGLSLRNLVSLGQLLGFDLATRAPELWDLVDHVRLRGGFVAFSAGSAAPRAVGVSVELDGNGGGALPLSLAKLPKPLCEGTLTIDVAAGWPPSVGDLTVAVRGTWPLGKGSLGVLALPSADSLELQGWMSDGAVISIHDALSWAGSLLGVPDLGRGVTDVLGSDVLLEDLQFGWNGDWFNTLCRLVLSAPISLPIHEGVALEAITVGVERADVNSGCQVRLGGTIRLPNDGELHLLGDVGSDFMLAGEATGLKLTNLINRFASNPLPRSLDPTLDDVLLALGRTEGGEWWVQSAASCSEGAIVFVVQRVGTKSWGIAVALDLKPIWVPEPEQAFLNWVNDHLGLEELAVAYSSLENVTLKFIQPTSSPALERLGGMTLRTGLSAHARSKLGTGAPQRLKSALHLQDEVALTIHLGDVKQVSAEVDGEVGGRKFSGTLRATNASNGLDIKAKGHLEWHLYHDLVAFDVEATVGAGGALITGSVQSGDLSRGIKLWSGFSLVNAGIMVGVDLEGVPSFGVSVLADYQRPGEQVVGANHVELGATFLFNSKSPSQSVVAGSLTPLSAGDVVRLVSGSHQASDLTCALDGLILTEINLCTIPASAHPVDLLVRGLIPEFAAQVTAACPSLKLSTPHSPDTHAVQLHLATASPTQWFLTDLVQQRHYVLRSERGAVVVGYSPQFYWCEQATDIGGIPFPAQTFVAGAAALWNWKSQVLVDVQTKGVVVQGAMDRLSFLSPLLRLEAPDGYVPSETFKQRFDVTDLGPALYAATFDADGKGARAEIEGSLTLLGLTGSVVLVATPERGFDIDVTRRAFSASIRIKGSLKIVGDPANLDARLRIEGRVDMREWHPFGISPHLGVPFHANASVDLELKGVRGADEKEIITGTAAGDFMLEFGTSGEHRYGPFKGTVTLSVTVPDLSSYLVQIFKEQDWRAKLTALCGMIKDKVVTLTVELGRLIQEGLQVAKEHAVEALRAAYRALQSTLQLVGEEAIWIAKQLNDFFTQEVRDIATLLKAAQYGPEAILQATFALNPSNPALVIGIVVGVLELDPLVYVAVHAWLLMKGPKPSFGEECSRSLGQ